jgi:small-conductance mechanosensitive channel
MDFGLILDQLRDRLAELGLRLSEFVPNLVTALFVMLAGWVLASLLKVLINRIGTSVVTRTSRIDFIGRGLDHGVGRALPRIMAAVAYWVLLLVFAGVAVEQLGLEMVTQLFARFTQYLPNVIIAAIVIAAGIVLGSGARAAVTSAAATAGVGNAATLGRLVQISVIAATALVAADQIGVESTLLIVVFAITVGTSMGGIALAFGIGSGTIVSNIIASHSVRKMYRPGQSVRIGSTEGRIIEIGTTSIAIDTADGSVHVPAELFSKEVSVLLRER